MIRIDLVICGELIVL